MSSYAVSKSAKINFFVYLIGHNFQLWKVGVILSCGVTGAIICISVCWMKKKKSSNGKRLISELVDPRWLKVGKVKELYFYPLKSGRGRTVTECKFTEFGISVNCDGQFTLRDR